MIFEHEKIILQVYEIQKDIHLLKNEINNKNDVAKNKKLLKINKQKLTSINNQL